jgi:hypothetical protein
MKTLFTLFVVVALSVCAAAETWTGTLSDSRCGAKHAAGTAADLKCIKACMEKGGVPVLVAAEGKVYPIATESVEKVTPLLGQKVTITGKAEKERFSGQLIIVETIVKAE